METMHNDVSLRWGARIFIIAVIIAGAWWFYTHRNKKYNYEGIKSYHKQNVKDSLTFFFKKLSKPAKKKKKRVNKTENMCRKIIEKIYNKKFPSIRPKFLKSPMTKKCLELDCYNAELKIALEYNGQQHYTFTPHFHKSKRDFYSQVHRDDWKRKRCRELGIRLIEIPYWVVPADLEGYIIRELQKKGCL